MSNVVMFPRHKLRTCSGTDCEGCFVCNGGLASCETCGGAEASLPTECPQVMMDAIMLTTVQQGVADYKDGEWWYYDIRAGRAFDER